MRWLVFSGILLLGLLAPHAASDVQDLRVKMDDPPAMGYFDAHTHWPGGILPWKTYLKMLPDVDAADLQAIDAPGPKQDYARLAALYERMFDYLRTLKGIPGSPRVCEHSKQMLATCQVPGKETKERKLQWLETAMRRLFTATVYSDYDSAYAIRGFVFDEWVKLSDKPTKQERARVAQRKNDFLQWILLELARNDLTYSEQSTSLNVAFAGLAKDAKNYDPSGWDYAEAWMKEAGAQIQPQLKKLGKPAPQVRFLAQFLTTMLAQVGASDKDKDLVMVAKSGLTSLDYVPTKDGTVAGEVAKIDRVEAVFRHHPNVDGIDILAPERYAVSAQGQKNFIALVNKVFAAAKEGRRPLVVHVHVGEGFPLMTQEKCDCDAFWEPTPDAKGKTPARKVPRILTDSKGAPLHCIVARNNVEAILSAVEQFRKKQTAKELAVFDNFVRIRFGHATHADFDQGKRMAAANVWADVNLTSNIATGALTIDRPELSTPIMMEYFDKHALVPLVRAGVKVVFGTDGGGVEHSFMSKEVALALHVFSRQSKDVKDSLGQPLMLNPRSYVNQMLQSAKDHVTWMQRRGLK